MDDKKPVSQNLAIEAKGLAKSYGGHQALNSINLEVKKGERLIVFGPNGAGKTTLIKLLSTLAKPSAGSVQVDGIDIRHDAARIRRRVSVVGHQTFLYDDLTVYENLRFYGKMYDVPHLEHRISEVVARVELDSRLHDRVGTLSHGLQQRTSLARAIIHNPSIMLFDEPEVGLDPHAIIIMRDMLGFPESREHTVLMTTHNIERGLQLGDRAIILNKGEIVYQASKDELDINDFQKIYDRYTGTDSK